MIKNCGQLPGEKKILLISNGIVVEEKQVQNLLVNLAGGINDSLFPSNNASKFREQLNLFKDDGSGTIISNNLRED